MDYRVYTKKYDEVVRPLDLVSEDELHILSRSFHKLCPVEDFEPLRERLTNIKIPDVDTVVSLLIDNSGSMRGWPITFAIGAVGIIGMYLDRLGVRNEILGFTTKTWKGGEPHEEWICNGKPANPGRLASLRHIVYKTVDERLESVRNNLALMQHEGMLKENIDGEAVEWACERLRSHQAERRVLLVISDGSPVDESSLATNFDPALPHRREKNDTLDRSHDNFLADHLREVIHNLTEVGDIKLDAIGIGHDVSEFYSVGDRIDKLEDLAPTAIAKLEALLK